MSLQRQALFWFAALAFMALFLWLLHGVLLPFVAGLALAYFLDPLVSRLEKLGIGRVWGTLVVIGACVLVFIASIILVAPFLVSQTTAFVARLPGYLQQLQSLVTDQNREWLQKLLGEKLPDVSKPVGDLVAQALGILGSFLQSLVSGGAAFLAVFSLLVVTPVVAFYLLVDWHRMVTALDNWLPRDSAETIRDLIHQMDRALAGFVRGQATVCMVLGTFYGVGLWFTGLNFGFLIGLLTGLFSFIPYVGSMTGLLLSMGIAIVQFWPNWSMIVAVLVIFAVGQAVEGNYLSPKLVGGSVGLHPVWLMFALFAFGSLFGFVGLLLAVPLAAVLGVLMRFAIKRYLASSFYHGHREMIP